jgi:hypothetical protein
MADGPAGGWSESEKLYRKELDNKIKTPPQTAKERAKSGIQDGESDHE